MSILSYLRLFMNFYDMKNSDFEKENLLNLQDYYRKIVKLVMKTCKSCNMKKVIGNLKNTHFKTKF